jgi:hypothetical protein
MSISRRQFLIASAVVAGGAAVGCGGLMLAKLKKTDPFALYVESTREVLARPFGDASAETIHRNLAGIPGSAAGGALHRRRGESQEGDGQEFDYGLDFTECGICEFYRAQRADELTPYLCLMDGVVSEVFCYGLVRYKTLAEGADVCDFRYKAGRETFLYPLRDGWPPKFLNEET